MRIVHATLQHVPPLARLMAASPLLRRYRVTERSARRNLLAALRARDIVLTAVEGDEVVGLAWLVPARALDRAAYLRLLLVANAHQSRGVGAALLARGERLSREARCRHVVMLVTKTNRRARSFYERHGYAHVGDLSGYVRRGIAESLYVKSWRT
ncbi:MAG: GNAT family N-acetyltransferase [Chloroflexi bacterium]|nr:MAG: GNAT family N-acetyltransferase [Chloroflexota bacterium]